MAILDRPMFRRPLTKDQLRGYGLPAFANGGVVQKFKTGGKVDLGYTESGAISDKPIFNPFKGLSKQDYDRMSASEVLEFYYGVGSSDLMSQLGFTPAPPGLAAGQAGALETSVELQEKDAARTQGATKDRKEQREKEEFKSIGEVLEDVLPKADEEGTTRVPPAEEKKKQEEFLEQMTKEELKKLDPRLVDMEKKKTTGTTEDTGGDTSTTDEEPDPVKERSDMERLKELAKERSALYKELIGDPEKMRRQQGFLQLAQFGLNLASARGGNLAEKIATSAKDPLQTFAALAREAAQDERAIEVAAIEGAERELALEKELKAKADKEYQFQSGVEFIARSKNIPESEAIDMYLGLESESQKGLTAFNDNLEQQDRSDDFLAAAQATGWVTESAMEDTDNYVVDGKLKIENISSPGNKVFYNLEDGVKVPYKIKDSSLTKTDELTSEDFVRLPGVKVISGT